MRTNMIDLKLRQNIMSSLKHVGIKKFNGKNMFKYVKIDTLLKKHSGLFLSLCALFSSHEKSHELVNNREASWNRIG